MDVPIDDWIRVAEDQVEYYEDLLGRQGYAWLNGYKRAVEFRDLISTEKPNVQTLRELAEALEGEWEHEGSAFWVMLVRTKQAIKTVESLDNT